MSDSSTITGCLSSCCCKFVAWAAGAAMVAFGIVALCQESSSDLRATCEHTDLWWVLLVQVLIGVGALGSSAKEAETDMLALCIQSAFILGTAGWGLSEARSSCAKHNLDGSKAWIMVTVWSVLVFGILALVLLGLCLVGACGPKERTRQPRPRAVSAALDLPDGEAAAADAGTLGGSPPAADFKSVV